MRSYRIVRFAGGAFLVAFLAYVVVWGAAWVVPLPGDFFIEGSRVVAFRDGTTAHVFLSPDDKWRIPVALADVDPHYLDALFAVEDQRFFQHGGVDGIAIVRALVTNVLAGRVVSGASTITMQLVRVREPRPRTLLSKAVEAFRAFQIEARYEKRTILEAYLQYIPFGRNIEGVEAASLAYFGHRANALSKSEIATLLAVPQSPSARVPSPSNVDRLTEARQSIARRLSDVGVFTGDDAALDLIASTPLPRRLRSVPRRAPHAALWLSERLGHADERLVTSLDANVQVMVEGTFARAKAGFRDLGIHNGAAVVVDH
ncbi:MAG: transglycosylase domain-containing protein, partial [Deltaproteobacteria bacterium]|nr:transglycosylase domain-containing protein [Deltaproteobacteria bacterium]